MKLLVDRLGEDPSELEFTGSAAWLASWAKDPALGDALASPVRFRLRVHFMGDDLYLEGVAEADFELGCGRCLGRYRQPVREPFRLVLEPAGARVPADPEGALALARDGLVLSEELEAGWYRGSEVELDPFLREVIANGLPQKPLCREECAGLCPSCGIDRNVESCVCQEEQPHSPFAALAGLRDRLVSEEGESK